MFTDEPPTTSFVVVAKLRVALGLVAAPAIGPLTAFLITRYERISLPDRWTYGVFRAEAILLYIALVPAFAFLSAIRSRPWRYPLTAIILATVIWQPVMGLPSDAAVNPVNPQFFLAPTMALFGLLAGLVFPWIAGNYPRISR